MYQLWGTAIHEARAQNKLENEFELSLAEAGVDDLFDAENVSASRPDDTTTTAAEFVTTTTAAEVTTTTSPYGPPPDEFEVGEAMARIRIPAIDLDKIVVSGVDVESLKDGPGQYRGTPLPGQAGNAAIAGHRTTYGAPFFSLNELVVGDEIFVSTIQGSFTYIVRSLTIVTPSDVYVLDPSDDNRLTLTTCNPRYSARQRLIVVAELQGEPAESSEVDTNSVVDLEIPGEDFPDDPPVTTEARQTATSTADATTSTTVVVAALANETQELDGGLSGLAISKWPAILWGMIAGLIWLGFWALGRAWKRWPSYAMGVPIFLVALFIFFENFARLLPANI